MITLAQATQIIDEALTYARSEGLAPMTVAVLDARGCVVAQKMEDGSSLLRPDIASGKAWSALAMGFGTRNPAGRTKSLPSFFAALACLAEGRVLPVPGGVLVRSAEGATLGAVGASGDVTDNDEACALAGIKTVGLTADRTAAHNRSGPEVRDVETSGTALISPARGQRGWPIPSERNISERSTARSARAAGRSRGGTRAGGIPARRLDGQLLPG